MNHDICSKVCPLTNKAPRRRKTLIPGKTVALKISSPAPRNWSSRRVQATKWLVRPRCYLTTCSTPLLSPPRSVSNPRRMLLSPSPYRLPRQIFSVVIPQIQRRLPAHRTIRISARRAIVYPQICMYPFTTFPALSVSTALPHRGPVLPRMHQLLKPSPSCLLPSSLVFELV